VTLHSLLQRTLGVVPIRIVLGVIALCVAHVAGSRWASALVAFAVGAVAVAVLAGNDPRRRLLGGGPEPLEWPEGATIAPRWRQALGATLPSTAAVTALALVAATFQPTLAAVLAGVCAGLGLAALFALPQIDATLYVDPRSGITYRRAEEPRPRP
jgi:hypothetical protein